MNDHVITITVSYSIFFGCKGRPQAEYVIDGRLRVLRAWGPRAGHQRLEWFDCMEE